LYQLTAGLVKKPHLIALLMGYLSAIRNDLKVALLASKDDTFVVIAKVLDFLLRPSDQ
jgi:hypothetical protein